MPRRRRFQLYMQPDREATGALLDRCVAAGFTALVLTVDQPAPGWSPRAYRTPVAGVEPARGADAGEVAHIRSVNMIGQRDRARQPTMSIARAWRCSRPPSPIWNGW